MPKVDPRKDLRRLYGPSAKAVAMVDVPALRFLMIDGAGDPDTTPGYATAVEALFSVSYAAKFMLKRRPGGIDYAVMPLEGLWWSEDPAAFTGNDRAAWQWTMMIMQPHFVDAAAIAAAIEQVRRKKPSPALERLRLEVFKEGRCAQILHVGPFSEEGPVVQRLHDFILEQGARLTGRHHEIYLSDIRRADPRKWKTILRQPMQ